MGRNQTESFEPFYFKSYGSTIGVARNLNELSDELQRLARLNPEALQHHLTEGHIIAWLNYINERDLAQRLKGVVNIEDFQTIVKLHLKRDWLNSCGTAPYHQQIRSST